MEVYGPSRYDAPLIRAKEALRTSLRRMLAYAFLAYVLLAWGAGMLEPHYLSSAPWFVWLAPLLYAVPAGVILYLLVRLLRFAFRR